MNSDRIAEIKAGHKLRNAVLVDQLCAKSVDLSESREIDLHFWAADNVEADSLARLLEDSGYASPKVSASVSAPIRWNVEVKIDSSISRVADDSFAFSLVDLANGANAEFDGWGTSI